MFFLLMMMMMGCCAWYAVRHSSHYIFGPFNFILYFIWFYFSLDNVWGDFSVCVHSRLVRDFFSSNLSSLAVFSSFYFVFIYCIFLNHQILKKRDTLFWEYHTQTHFKKFIGMRPKGKRLIDGILNIYVGKGKTIKWIPFFLC